MGTQDFGKLLLIAGSVFVLLGLFFLVGGKMPFLGKLPGDFLFRKGNTTIFIPITTSMLLSHVLTFILWLWRK
jgi:hypothetical protein